jgi:hypothetical protein
MQVERQPTSQDNFDGLAVPDLQHDGGCLQTLVDYEKFAGGSGPVKSWGEHLSHNSIKEEVFQFIAGFEKSALSHVVITQGSDAMDTSTVETILDFEPLRALTFRAPPKRFYQSFWRSAAWRLLKQEKQPGKKDVRGEA